MKRNPKESQTWAYLRGDLEPRRVEWTDLRNDYAADELKQAQNIVLRYLETMPAQGTVNLASMAEDISRHYPFQGEGVEFFRRAVESLQDAGWIKKDGDELELDKIARVTDRYLRNRLRSTR